MNDLNLLPSQAKFQAERMHLKKVINQSMWTMGGIWLIIVIIVFGLNLYRQLDVNRLNKKLQSSADQYKNLSQDILVNQQVKQQVKVVALALKERFEYGSSLENVRSFFSDKVTIDGFDLSVTKKYKVIASVPELKNINEVEIIIDDINHGKIEGFKSATMESLAIDKGKGWSFTMEVNLL